MGLHIADLLIQWISGAGATFTPLAVLWLIRGQKDTHDKIKGVADGVEELKQNDFKILKARMRTETERIIASGEISVIDLDNLEELFAVYQKMGGNGIVEQNMVKIRGLPRKG